MQDFRNFTLVVDGDDEKNGTHENGEEETVEPPLKRRRLNINVNINANTNAKDVKHKVKLENIKFELKSMQRELFGIDESFENNDFKLIVDAVAKIAVFNCKETKELIFNDKNNILMRINDCRKDIKMQHMTDQDKQIQNISFQLYFVNGWPMIMVVASKDIAVGEALWADYGPHYSRAMRNLHCFESAKISNAVNAEQNLARNFGRVHHGVSQHQTRTVYDITENG